MTQKLPTLTPADCDAILRRIYGDDYYNDTLDELIRWGCVMMRTHIDESGKPAIRIYTPPDFTKRKE